MDKEQLLQLDWLLHIFVENLDVKEQQEHAQSIKDLSMLIKNYQSEL